MSQKLFQQLSQELCQEISVLDLTEASLHHWLKQQAIIDNYHLPYLLAHAEDGVIWGRFDEKNTVLETSEQVFPECKFASLRLATLQQCRIFGEAGQLLLWKSNGKWRSHLILQSKVSELIKSQKICFIAENQVLLGTQGTVNGNFTLLSDGSQGLKHAVPLTDIFFSQDKTKLHRPVRLEVHHYFSFDSDGLARIFLSRLVSLKKQELK
ncbi:MAG: CRISPR-associated protein Csx19 [Crinalium sp.]